MKPEELSQLVAIASEASVLIRSIYEQPFTVQYKGPSDPVTEADRAANELICRRIDAAFPGCPIVAEESPPEDFAEFRRFSRVFFVDPVDGTREFVEKNDEFVVMIGVVEGADAVAGVLAAPATHTTWVGGVQSGIAYRLEPTGQQTPIRVSQIKELSKMRVVASRSHRTRNLERALESLGALEIRAQGSAGLKGARVAEATAEAYVAPHYAGKRWDVCAVDAVVVAAGGRVTDALGEPIDYRAPSLVNDRGVVVTNGWLHEAVLERLAAARSATPLE